MRARPEIAAGALAFAAVALMLAAPALAAPPATTPPAATETPPADPNAPQLVELKPGVWMATVTCAINGNSATGSVTFPSATAPEIFSLPHTGLARARACLTLSQTLRVNKDWTGVSMAAHAGLSALGEDYATPGGGDPTRQGLREAEDALRQGGSPMKGADQLIDVLDVRIHLYEKRYAGGLAEGR